jgi:hypothetical protein
MPVVIRELVVRAVVSPTGGDSAGQLAIDERALKRLKKEITKEVSEQVLQQINRKSER